MYAHKNIVIRTANYDDRYQVLNLLDEVFSAQQRSLNSRNSENFWNWKYEDSVYGKSSIIVAEINDRIIASGTLWPWKLRYGDTVLSALQPCDTVVHPEFQGLGIFKKIIIERIKIANQGNTDLLFNFPNSNSINGYLRMGWYFISKIPWMIRIFSPVDIIKNLKEKKTIGLPIPEQSVLDTEFCEYLSSQTEYTNSFKTWYENGYFNWRYNTHPTRKYGLIKYESKKGNCAAIFTLLKRGNVKEMVVVDFVGSQLQYGKLLEKIIKDAKLMKVSYLAFIKLNSTAALSLYKFGFIPIKNKNFVCLPLNSAFKEKFCNISYWDLTAGMHDSI